MRLGNRTPPFPPNILMDRWLNWLEHVPLKHGVLGSSPRRSTTFMEVWRNWQRIWFLPRGLGVRLPPLLPCLFHCRVAQCSAASLEVVGCGFKSHLGNHQIFFQSAFFCFSTLLFHSATASSSLQNRVSAILLPCSSHCRNRCYIDSTGPQVLLAV